jgi:hypothetical protein
MHHFLGLLHHPWFRFHRLFFMAYLMPEVKISETQYEEVTVWDVVKPAEMTMKKRLRLFSRPIASI